MPINMLDAVDFATIPALRFVVPVVTSDPAGYEAGFIYNSTSKQVKYHNGTAWVALGPAGAGGPPTGAAGGDLTGSYPDPQIAAGVIVDADVNASAAIAQSKIATLVADLAAKLPTASPTVASGFLTLTQDPTAALHAATKQYVDLTAQGLDFKNSVRLATTTNITLSGVQIIDSSAGAAGDRILVKNQTLLSQNGIWVMAAGAWSRATDANGTNEISGGTVVPVVGGMTMSSTLWICTQAGSGSPLTWNPDSDASTWTQFMSVADLQAGAGLTKSGSSIDFVAGDASLTVAADSVVVASAPKWTTARTLTLGGDLTGNVSIDGSANATLTATVAGGPGAKHFAGNVGAGTAVVINHALNTRDVSVDVYRATTPWDTVECTVERTDVNNVTLRFAVAVAANAYRCVVQGR